MTNDQIDMAEAALLDLLKIGTALYPPLAVASPFVSAFLRYEFRKIKIGVADGTIVPDGMGGLVPASNSHYDPKTGEFL